MPVLPVSGLVRHGLRAGVPRPNSPELTATVIKSQLEDAAERAGLTWRDEPPFTEPAGARPRSHITAVLQAGYRRAAAEETLIAERAATGTTTKAAERAHHDADREMHARALAAIKAGISSDTLAFALDFHHLR